MRQTLVSLLLFAIVSCGGTAWAADQMKPGLWEMAIKSGLLKSVPTLTPQQIKKMQEMGIKVPKISDGGVVSQVCITKEMAASDTPPTAGIKAMGCESKDYEHNGTQYSMDVVCNGPDMIGQGRMEGTFSSDEAFTSTYQFKGVAHGQPIDQNSETTGKWLSDDCDGVKPMGRAGQK